MRSIIIKIKNFFYWGWKLRNDRNWDSHYLIKIIHYKLSLMKKEMLDTPNPYVWTTDKNDRGRKALLTCVELSKRLTEENSYYIDKHYEKYPLPQNLNYTRTIVEQKEFKRAIEKDRKIHKIQKEMFFNLLQKWYDYWWT